MSGPEMQPEAAARILEERARALARRPAPPEAEDAFTIVTFRLGGERYGVDAAFVREVFRLTHLALLPGAQPPASALTAWRGDLLMLLDLRRALGLEANALNDLRQVIVVDTGAGVAGILTDEVLGSVQLRAGEIDARDPARVSGPYVRGVSPDAIVVLDTHAFASGDAREAR